MGLKSFPTYDTTKGMETIYSSISRMPKFSPHLYQHFPEISTQLLQISPVVNHEIFLGLFEIYRHLRTNFPTAGLFDCCPISRWSWVSGSTQITMLGLVHLPIFASNNRGTSKTKICNPSTIALTLPKKSQMKWKVHVQWPVQEFTTSI